MDSRPPRLRLVRSDNEGDIIPRWVGLVIAGMVVAFITPLFIGAWRDIVLEAPDAQIWEWVGLVIFMADCPGWLYLRKKYRQQKRAHSNHRSTHKES